MTEALRPYREPLRATLLRTVAIAFVLGAVLTRASGGGAAQLPGATAVMLWPSFGGHWVEVLFLNWLRPRLPATRTVQVAARVGLWFVAGVGFIAAMAATARALFGPRAAEWPAWWVGGLAFIGIELVAHLALQLRGRPSVFDGRG